MKVITDVEVLREEIDELHSRTIALYVTPTGDNLSGVRGDVRASCLSVCVYDGYDGFYVPLRHSDGENIPQDAIDVLQDMVNVHNIILWDAPPALQALHNEGITLDKFYDGMLAMHLQNEREESFTLTDIGKKYDKGFWMSIDEDLHEAIRERFKELKMRVPASKIPSCAYVLRPEKYVAFAMHKAKTMHKLTQFLIESLNKQGIMHIFDELCDYEYVMFKMMHYGIHMDENLLNKYYSEAKANYDIIVNDLNELAGYKVNPSSTRQVCDLFGTLTADKEILNDIIEEGGEEAKKAILILEARTWKKAYNTYYEPYIKRLDVNGDIHATYNMTGTYTGRLSCSNPNLQAVAKKTDVYKVKDAFVAREGCTLIQADYKQAEMRLAVHYTQDKDLCRMIENGLDMHAETAEQIEMPREVAKRINFSVLYGVGASTLARIAHIDKDDAQVYLDKFHNLHPGFKTLAGAYEGMAMRDGYIRLWTGRRQHFNNISDTRKAMANLLQGGVAEIMRHAILKLDKELVDVSGKLLMQVHDSVLIEVPDAYVGKSIKLIKKVMCDFDFNPKPDVDIMYGKQLGFLEEYE